MSNMEFANGKILASIADGVGRVVFNQPEKRNAMSVDMWGGMGEALDLFAEDASVRCVVLQGAGDKAFVSGADISQFEGPLQRRCAAGIRPHHQCRPAEADQLRQAGDCADPRLLHGRRPRHRNGDGYPHRLG